MDPSVDLLATTSAGHDSLQRNLEVVRLGLVWLEALLGDHIRGGTPSEAVRPARQAYERARAAMVEAGTPAQIDRISAIFRLAAFDEDLLLLAAAPRLHSAFADLIERGNGRAGLYAPTQHLAARLLAGEEAAHLAHARLAPTKPLRRYALIEASGPGFGPFAALSVDERLSRYLMGEDELDGRVRRLLTEPRAGSCPARHQPVVDQLAHQIGAGGRAAAVLIGPARIGRRAAAVLLASEAGLQLAEISPRAVPADPEARSALLPLLAREAALTGLAYLVDAAPADRRDDEAMRLARHLAEDLLNGLSTLVVAVAEGRLDAPLGTLQVRLSPLDANDRKALWSEALTAAPRVAAPDIELVAEHFQLGPGEIAELGAQLGDGDGRALWRVCRDAAGAGLETLAEKIEPRFTWDDIVLPGPVLETLRAIAGQVRCRSAVYGRGGFGRKLVRGRGVTALFAGPSGVGKTMAAEVIAGDLDLDLYRIDLSSVVSKYIGETEKNLRLVFDAAEATGAVLFFDEADALFGKRSEVNSAHDRYANIEVSYLLQRMESYSGLAILATNMKGHLDTAFLRRLRFMIDVPFPDAVHRRMIWAQAFPPETATEGLDLDALSRIEVAGGNISVIAVNAAFLAADEGGPVRMTHVARAARAELRKLDKELRASWAAPASGARG
jgi:SpoVK/Ycf46/Vps4 family AAA+-type ATPase